MFLRIDNLKSYNIYNFFINNEVYLYDLYHYNVSYSISSNLYLI